MNDDEIQTLGERLVGEQFSTYRSSVPVTIMSANDYEELLERSHTDFTELLNTEYR